MLCYHLVEFLREEGDDNREVAVVPDSWYIQGHGSDADQCYWPANGQTTWVQKGRAPDPQWPLYQVKLLRSTPDYARVLRMEKRALEQSDISNSESVGSDQGPRRKRKRAPRDRWSPGPHTTSVSQLPHGDAETDSDSSSRSILPATSRSPPASNRSPPAPNRSSLLTTVTTSPQPYPRNPVAHSFHLPLPPAPRTTLLSSPSTSSQDSSAVTGSRALERVFQLLEDLKQESANIRRKVDRILAAMEEGTSGQVAQAELPEGFTFPVESPEELERLEVLLARDDLVRQKMVRHLWTVGGRHIKDCIRRVLSALLTTTVARQYNYMGQKGKKSLSALRCLTKTIYEGVQKLYADATQSQIREVVALWLSGSRDRERRRNNRIAAAVDS